MFTAINCEVLFFLVQKLEVLTFHVLELDKTMIRSEYSMTS